jgi:tetratricopeptide (TPR) repeat protein
MRKRPATTSLVRVRAWPEMAYLCDMSRKLLLGLIGMWMSALLYGQGALRLYSEAQDEYLRSSYTLAEEKLRLALKIEKRNPDAWFLWGQCRWQQKDYKGAIGYYDKALKLTPSEPEYHFHKGVALEDMGKVKKAIRSYVRTTRLSPQYTLAWKRLGTIFYRAGDMDMAVQQYSEVVKVDPLDKEGFLLRGIAQTQRGDYPEALADFTFTLALDPEDVDAYDNRARIHARQGDARAAIQDFSQVIDLRPRDRDARMNRGVILLALGLRVQALADLDTAIALDSTLSDAWWNRAFLLHEEGDWDAARLSAIKATRLAPNDAQAWLLLGKIEFRRRKHADAVLAFDRCIALDKRQAEAYLHRGEAKRVLGDESSACKDWKQVLRYGEGELVRKAAQWHAIICE